MDNFVHKIRHLTARFPGWRLVLASIIAAAILTALFVVLGLDWFYFVWIQNMHPFGPLMAADGLGYAFPFLLPLGLIAAAGLRPGRGYFPAAIATLVAAGLAIAVSVALKSLAGRASPPHHTFGADLALADNSAGFDFGFMNEAILGGWPSSHATVAFAATFALAAALPQARGLHYVNFALAAFIGVGVTLGFHWLSEFISGALIGTSIGIWVGHFTATRTALSDR
jgi:membrane-associated phospholipid phosphatase